MLSLIDTLTHQSKAFGVVYGVLKQCLGAPRCVVEKCVVIPNMVIDEFLWQCNTLTSLSLSKH